MSWLVNHISFPHMELHILRQEPMFYKLIDEIAGLPTELTEGLGASDPREYNIDQLEALRKLGQNLKESVIRACKENGTALWIEAGSLTGKEAGRKFDEAEVIWGEPFMNGSLDGIAGLCNIAARSLKKNK